jgi:hypothetical protein
MHVESHIRRQLRGLENAYIRKQFTIAATNYGLRQRRKVSQLQEECRLLAGSLSDRRRLLTSVFVALTALTPLIPLLVATHPVEVGRFLQIFFYYVILAILLTPGIAALTAYADAFRCKRELFGAGLSGAADNTEVDNITIYELEDKLFAVLDQPKRSERAADLWACTIVLGVWTIGMLVALLVAGKEHTIDPYDWVIATVTTVPPLLVLAAAVRRRKRAER